MTKHNSIGIDNVIESVNLDDNSTNQNSEILKSEEVVNIQDIQKENIDIVSDESESESESESDNNENKTDDGDGEGENIDSNKVETNYNDEEESNEQDLSSLTVNELKKIAKDKGIKNSYRMNKKTLIENLTN